MSGFDFAARGLAAKALQLGSELASAGGSAAIGRTRSEAGALLEPVEHILDRIDLSPASFGALADGTTSDHTALAAFASALQQAGEGVSRLDPRTYTVGTENADEGLSWSRSNGGLIGRGMDRTIIHNVHSGATHSMKFSASCENMYFADMTFIGRVLPSGAQSVKNLIFHRCRFTTNHTNDGVIRYADIHMIRPRIIGAGQVSAATGQGLSFSGKGDHVVLDQPYFDGNLGPQLENAGCDRLLMKDAAIRAATLPIGVTPISYSAVNASYNYNEQCEIDGLSLVRSTGDPFTRPTMDTEFYFECTRGLRLRRINAAINNPDTSKTKTSVIHVVGAGTDGEGTTKTSRDVTITDCDLWSNAPNKALIEFTTMEGVQLVARNRLHHADSARTGSLIAAFAPTAGTPYTVRLTGNQMSGERDNASKSFLIRTGTGAFTVEDNNDGLPLRFRGTVTVAAGSLTSGLIAHGLPGGAKRLSAKPLGDTTAGGVPWTTEHGAGTLLRANFATALTTAVDVEVEAEFIY